jgi:hypothetical protein
MTFAMWWAGNYKHTGEVPEQYYDMMRSAYEQGKSDEREACAKVCESRGPTLANSDLLAELIRMRSNSKLRGAPGEKDEM